MISFRYRDSNDKELTGEIRILSGYGPLEMDVEANGWTFHIIVGRHRYGNYICIPNWNIGSEFSKPKDEFWNSERLRDHTGLHPDNIKAVVRAVAVAGEWIEKCDKNECG